jgi:hypothetical protein
MSRQRRAVIARVVHGHNLAAPHLDRRWKTGWLANAIFEYLEGRCCICGERARSRQTVVMRTRRLHPA